MLSNFILIGFGGMLGAITRYIFYAFTDNAYHKHAFPFGTLLVNLLGSLIIGILIALAVKYNFFSRHHSGHYFFITGFLGAFTTFSTFSQDNMFLLFDKHYGAFALNIILNVGLGLALTIAGFMITKRMI